MQYLFEVPQCPGVTEYLAAEGLAVDAVRPSDTFPKRSTILDIVRRSLFRRWCTISSAEAVSVPGSSPKKRTSVLFPDAKGPVTATVTGPSTDPPVKSLCLSLLEVQVGQRIEGAGAEAAPSLLLRSEGPRCSGSRRGALLAAGTLFTVLAPGAGSGRACDGGRRRR